VIRLEFSFVRYDLPEIAETSGPGVQGDDCHRRSLFGALSSQLQYRKRFVKRPRRSGSFPQMTSSTTKTTTRTVVASFAAGASAMVFLGLIAPVAMQGGGLAIREAFAAEVQQTRPVIEPLDVQAINAQLAEADRTMDAMRATTDDDIARLRRLTPR
jgi:hypothetical protein